MTVNSNKNKLLFIDDEKICHTLVELIVPNFTDFELLSAHTGTQGLDLAKRYCKEIIIVLSDIMMPDIGGFEIYDEFQKDPNLQTIPFILQSGFSKQENEISDHIARKKAQILYKPYRQQELIDAINRAVEK